MNTLCIFQVSLLLAPMEPRPVSVSTFDTSKTVYASGTEFTGPVVSITGRQFGIMKFEDGKQTSELIVFDAVDVLYSGKLTVNKTGECYGYALSDILVDDIVRVNFIRNSGKLYAFEICISERPGQNVPPSRRPPYNGGIAYHEQKNVWNDIKNGVVLQESKLRFHGFHKEADRLYGKKDPMKKDDAPLKAPSATIPKDKPPTEKK
jgi:hypothetical protein